jgi:hypothetical protein
VVFDNGTTPKAVLGFFRGWDKLCGSSWPSWQSGLRFLMQEKCSNLFLESRRCRKGMGSCRARRSTRPQSLLTSQLVRSFQEKGWSHGSHRRGHRSTPQASTRGLEKEPTSSPRQEGQRSLQQANAARRLLQQKPIRCAVPKVREREEWEKRGLAEKIRTLQVVHEEISKRALLSPRERKPRSDVLV